jgi:thiosulfate/3-mercaptopyruvate sulfurtransferase
MFYRMARVPAQIILFAFIAATTTMAAADTTVTPLVSVPWLAENLDSNDQVLVDLRGQRTYLASHIPGAVNTDYGRDGWRQTINKIPGLLPTSGAALQKLVKKIGQLGIGNTTHVVLIAPGWSAGDMGMATRLYWSFKVLGHDRVSILDGGMAAWQADLMPDGKTPRNPVKTGSETNKPRSFVPVLQSHMLMDMEDVIDAGARGGLMLDARPTMQYMGLQKSGAVRRPGTLPGAKSLPGQWLTDNGGGKFRPTNALKKLLATTGVQDGAEMFVFCNTGHWASITWFVASELLGQKKARLYDGSLADWTARNNAPLERKIKLN